MPQQTQRTFQLHPVTEEDLVELRVRHGLVELPIPEVTGHGPETVARWFASLRDQHGLTCRYYTGKGGTRWLLARDGVGMYHYARIDVVLASMEREATTGALVGGPTAQQRQDRLAAWLARGGKAEPGSGS